MLSAIHADVKGLLSKSKVSLPASYICCLMYSMNNNNDNRPNPLLGLIYCEHLRCLATGWTAAYHVGSRCQHLYLYYKLVQLVMALDCQSKGCGFDPAVDSLSGSDYGQVVYKHVPRHQAG